MNKKIVSLLSCFIMFLSSSASTVYAETELIHETQKIYQLMENYIAENYPGDAKTVISDDNTIEIIFREVSKEEHEFNGAAISKSISEYLENNNIDSSKVNVAFRIESPAAASPVIAGDIDHNDSIDVTDLTELSLALLGDKELTADQQKAADIDGDGAVTLADLARLQQYLSKKINSL
ncbi:dockerin type I repeat-containing protein [Ruminococcus sp. HUN007]|jgi:hypothetical protein|uniref:dockerin type I repeat-containing protein n=1 Tax=Ruminococcus sp. HUN007 TaxID=1514668 RepID=UPI0005D1EDA8|nr:dockerin type I repeat-containing protein [Ruminococcus sp. HUN007]